MKVFISWSGNKSHKVAVALRDWLPLVLQVVKPFVSSIDIYKGGRWNDVLAAELEDTQFGIICLTPANVKSPWLHFEAGALSKSIDRASVSPFLIGVKPNDITGPLTQFQTTVATKEDVFNLVHGINRGLDENLMIDLTLLRKIFEKWWPDLDIELKKIDNIIDNKDTGYKWLFYSEYLGRIQQEISFRSLWIVTPYLDRVLNDACPPDIVKSNIERGVEYKFILPVLSSGDDETEREDQISKILVTNKLEMKKVCSDQFGRSVVTSFFILNPTSDDDRFPLKVLLQAPVVSDGSYMWMEADPGAAHAFVERFREMCQGEDAASPEPMGEGDSPAK